MVQVDPVVAIAPPRVGPERSTDGRVARRGRNRLAVIDAAIELFSEHNLSPGMREVAERCGLSPRSVQRYFDDGDALLSAAVRRQLDIAFPMYHLHAIGKGPLSHRISAFVTMRLRAHEVLSPTARAATLLALNNDLVRENFAQMRVLLREQIELQFAPELGACSPTSSRVKLAAIDALFQFETLDYYRQRREFSVRVTHSMLVDTLRLLLS